MVSSSRQRMIIRTVFISVFLFTIPLSSAYAAPRSGPDTSEGVLTASPGGGNHSHEQEEPQKTNHNETHQHEHGDETKQKPSGKPIMERLLPGLSNAPNIHPMIAHFPITLLVIATVLVLSSWVWKPTNCFLCRNGVSGSELVFFR